VNHMLQFRDEFQAFLNEDWDRYIRVCINCIFFYFDCFSRQTGALRNVVSPVMADVQPLTVHTIQSDQCMKLLPVGF
jgi:hypothetical protein